DRFDEKLRQDSRDSRIKGCLSLALKDRTQFLSSMEKLSREQLTIEDLDQFIKFFGESSQENNLKIHKEQLDNQLRTILDEKQKNNNELVVTEQAKLIKINYEMSEIQKQLDYYVAKFEITKEINIDDLIVLLGEKIELVIAPYTFSKETIDKIIAIGKITENKNVAIAIVQFLNILSDTKQIEEEIEKVLANILPQIPQDDTVNIVLTLSKKLVKIVNYSSLLKFMYEILIENKNKILRQNAFKLLQTCEFYSNNLKYINQTIKLEKKCLNKDKNIFEDCLEQVKIQNKLTLNCFEELIKDFSVNEISKIIEQIIEQDIQKIPKFFIEKFLEYQKMSCSDKNSQTTANIMSIRKSLIRGKYINLTQIQNIEELIDHPNVSNDVFDILFAEFTNGNNISNEIIEKVKRTAITNEYAENLIKLIDKTSSSIDILRNPRKHLIERKDALDNIVNDKRNHTPYAAKILQILIKNDNDLREDCFKALITILPIDYTKTDFKIDLNEIAKSIYDCNISIENLAILVYKDKTADLSPILPIIIDRIVDQQVSVLTLLGEISCFEQGDKLIGSQIENLLSIASDTTNNELRIKIVNIIENSIKSKEDRDNIEILKRNKIDETEIKSCLTNELHELNSLSKLDINKEMLQNLNKNIQEQGHSITEDKIILLIEALVNSKYENLQQQISETLLQIDIEQGLNNKARTILYDLIIQNSKLISISSIVCIVTIALSRSDTEVPDKIIQNLWIQFERENIEDETFMHSLIYAVTTLIAKKEQEIPKNILKRVANVLTNKRDDIQLRIACANILSKEIEQNLNYVEISRSLIKSLQVVALESRNNKNEDILNKFIFQILEKSAKENDLSDQFFIEYYDKLKKRAIILEENLSKQDSLAQLSRLDAYILTESNNLKKFHLLNTLNSTLVNCQNIDMTIFNQFDSSEWEKEILCSELLTGIFKLISQKDEGINEFELDKFRKNINLVEINLTKTILKILIDKQNIYQFDLESVNDILFMLLQLGGKKRISHSESLTSAQSHEETLIATQNHSNTSECVFSPLDSSLDETTIIIALNILQKKDDSFFLELQELWLSKRFEHFKIKFNDENLKILNTYLTFRCEIINHILSKIKENTKIEELIEFFVILTNCGLTQNSCENFLVNEIVHKTNIKNWQLKLNDRLVGLHLTNEYPIYSNYLKNMNNYKLALSKNVVFTKNAYNQANTTYSYNANDIVQISSEWMKDFANSFRITKALDQQVDRSLRDILTKILIEYKQDQKSTIIPLNIVDNHWIVLTIIHHQNKDIALYKDSLGEDNFVKKREEIQKILLEKFENIIFKFHKSCDQSDCYNSGVFVLANMKIIAKQLIDNKKYFIENYEMNNFISEKGVIELRQETFPKMYALSICQLYKRKKVVNHHSVELKLIQKLLEEKNDIVNYSIVKEKEKELEKNELRLSIELPEEENLVKKNYQYLYVIETSKYLNFDHSSDLRKKIIAILGIKEIYSVEENVVKILDQKLTVLSKIQQKKLDQSELTIKTSDSELKGLLDELSVDS
ncbi:unnamed protein product, partial [Didymodactylos carnosus]